MLLHCSCFVTGSELFRSTVIGTYLYLSPSNCADGSSVDSGNPFVVCCLELIYNTYLLSYRAVSSDLVSSAPLLYSTIHLHHHAVRKNKPVDFPRHCPRYISGANSDQRWISHTRLISRRACPQLEIARNKARP